MSENRTLTERDFEAFVQEVIKANETTASALFATSHQAVANVLVNALLVRELGRNGLIDADKLRAEAISRAETLGSAHFAGSVVSVIRSIFGDEPPRVPQAPASNPFTVIRGGREDT